MSAPGDNIPRPPYPKRYKWLVERVIIPMIRQTRVRPSREFRQTPDGLIFRPQSSSSTVEQIASTELFPLRIFVYNNSGNTEVPEWRMWVYYGLVNGKIPILNGSQIGTSQNDASVALTTKTSGSDVVYVLGTLTDSDANLLYNATFSGFQIATGAALPSDTTTTRSFELGRVYWSATGRPTSTNSNSHSVWFARAGGPGADYVTWAAS